MLEDNKGLIAMSKEGQYRKCIAEKKRRKQENYYIKELAELLYEGFGDDVSLTSKSDKSAILERTIERIERVSNGMSTTPSYRDLPSHRTQKSLCLHCLSRHFQQGLGNVILIAQ